MSSTQASAKEKFDHINGLSPAKFMEDDQVRDAFILLNRKLHKTDPDEAGVFYDREVLFMKRVLMASIDPTKPKNDLRKCSTFSLYSAFMDLAMNGDVLSLNPEDKLAYLEKRGYVIGQDNEGKKLYENRVTLKITPYGELAMRIQSGQIKHADEPVVVYEGDTFGIRTNDRMQTVIQWSSQIPRASKKIIGSFVKITRPDDTWLVAYMLEEEIVRLKGYSERNNRSGGANELYSSAGGGIDSGFLKAKQLKHSFKTFPKLRVRGTTTQIDDLSEEVDQEEGGEDLGWMTPEKKPAAVKPAVNDEPDFDDQGDEPPFQDLDGKTGVRIKDDEDNW